LQTNLQGAILLSGIATAEAENGAADESDLQGKESSLQVV
jgi:hypothetical protein